MNLITTIASDYTLTFLTVFFGGVIIGALVATTVNDMVFARRHEKMLSDLQMNDLTNHYRMSDVEAELHSLRQHIMSVKVVNNDSIPQSLEELGGQNG
jgi:hypothetical protein